MRHFHSTNHTAVLICWEAQYLAWALCHAMAALRCLEPELALCPVISKACIAQARVCLSPPTQVCPKEQIPRSILVSSQGGKQVKHRKMERRDENCSINHEIVFFQAWHQLTKGTDNHQSWYTRQRGTARLGEVGEKWRRGKEWRRNKIPL